MSILNKRLRLYKFKFKYYFNMISFNHDNLISWKTNGCGLNDLYSVKNIYIKIKYFNIR